MTGEHSLPALEAAHILPCRHGGEHRADKGMLLRSDPHRLFDRGYVTITPDYIFRVGDSLRRDFQNGRSYLGLDGSRIAVPDHELWRPSAHSGEFGREVFRGRGGRGHDYGSRRALT